MTRYYIDEGRNVLVAVDGIKVLELKLLGEIEPSSAPASDARPRSAKSKQSKTKKGGKGCSICGTPGHNRKTCPEVERAGGVPPRSKAKPTPKQGDALDALDNGYTPPRRGAMTRMAFSRVKIAQSHDIPAESIARNLEVSIGEVKKAIEAETYGDYAGIQ